MTENQYHKEYREYLEFALQKYLQEKEGLSEYDARTQVCLLYTSDAADE